MSDHKGNAQNWLEMADHHSDWAGEAPKQTVERYLAAAQAEATLYLAEQQRIANLIAAATWNNHVLLSGGRRPDNEEMDEAAEWEQVGRMFVEIREALGLR